MDGTYILGQGRKKGNFQRWACMNVCKNNEEKFKGYLQKFDKENVKGEKLEGLIA